MSTALSGIPSVVAGTVGDLALGFRFGVFFLAGGVVPNPIDIRFQKVSGLSAEISTSTVTEGGQNLYTHRLPERVGYSNLVLERGVVFGPPSALEVEFNAAMTLFKFAPCHVIVTVFGDTMEPMAAWQFFKAYPVKWATAGLDASQESIVIDTMELAYTRMQNLRL